MNEDIKNRLIALGHQFENETPILIKSDGRIACECDYVEDGILPTFHQNHDMTNLDLSYMIYQIQYLYR